MKSPPGSHTTTTTTTPALPAPPAPADRRALTLTIVETNSSTSTATWRTMIPSKRRSILAARAAQRSFCLPGERAETEREAGSTGGSEQRREKRGGRIPALTECLGLAPRPPARPGWGRSTPGGWPRGGSSRP